MKQKLQKIILVDDDAMLRIGLRALIPWQQYGYEIAGEAEDGAQALELCQTHMPDLLITDMKMDGMDGLALLRALPCLPRRPAVIVLSGYDEFALVRDAMRLGAADYLLKLELSAPRLLECLHTVAPAASADSSVDRVACTGRERVLRDLVSHFYLRTDEMDQALHREGICFYASPVWCMLIRAGDWFRFEDAGEQENHTLQYSLQNISMEIVSDCMDAYSVAGKTGELYVFASLKPPFAGKKAIVRKTAQRLRTMLLQYLDITCVVSLGSGGPDARGLDQACRQASEAMRRRFCIASDGVIAWEDVSTIEPAPANGQTARWHSMLTAGLNTLDWPRAEQALEGLIAYFTRAGLSHEGMLQAAVALQSGIYECLERYGRNPKEILKDSYQDILGLLSLNSASDMVAWLRAMQEALALFFEQEAGGSTDSAVLKAEQMIIERYAQPLSLQELADELQISPGYLSMCMKKQTGMNFSEYLMDTRMAQARRLLRQSDEKIARIAEQVGYPDQFYFSRLFKRVTGMTPREFRRREQVQK